jgi:tRNA A37 threonylcarbamoyladenosine dehydratase
VDGVIDACDQIKAKTAMAAWARQTRAPVCERGGSRRQAPGPQGGRGRPGHTTHDPLLAQVRYRLRKEHGAPREGARWAWPASSAARRWRRPIPSCAIDGADGSLNCHGYGSVVSVTATFGQCAAGWLLDNWPRRQA